MQACIPVTPSTDILAFWRVGAKRAAHFRTYQNTTLVLDTGASLLSAIPNTVCVLESREAASRGHVPSIGPLHQSCISR